MAGLLFVEHGTSKLLGIPAMPAHGPAGVAGVLELVGGTLLALGLFTRVVAFILSGEMAFAYFMVHAPKSFYPIVSGGELAALYCFVFLYLAAAGGGPLSIDRMLRKG